jgi:hypothetical protein
MDSTITFKASIKESFIPLDRVLNTRVKVADDGYGYADEMLSARAWRLRKKSRLYIWIDRLFFWDKDHCEECYKIEMERKQLPPEYRILT